MASSSSLSGRSVSPPPPPRRGGEEIVGDDDDHKKVAEEEKRVVALDDDEDEDEEDEFEYPTPPVSTKWIIPPEEELQFHRNLRGRPELTWEELSELIEQENEKMVEMMERLEDDENLVYSPPPPSIPSDDWDCFAHSKFGSGDVRFLNTCIINGLDLSTKDGCLVQAFSPFGEILDAKVVKKSKGLGFVTFASEDSVFKAIEAMNNTFLQGLQITLRKLQFLPGYSGPI
ncbi:hypothetical protein RIF29_16110 [Crotalaria pallida]|uniref:RRM domain-containing protein n=1 Tax=Crotalaria pallida TaxID=3830 RepID=A0AAN9IE59_CROPI